MPGIERFRNFYKAGLVLSLFGFTACSQAAATEQTQNSPTFDAGTKTLKLGFADLRRYDNWYSARHDPSLDINQVLGFLVSKGCTVEDIVPIPEYASPARALYRVANPECVSELQ